MKLIKSLFFILVISNFIYSDVEILWKYNLKAPSFGSAALGDIDKDGKLEIVFGTYFNDENIYALNSEDGSLLWKYNTESCNDASPVIFDVDKDGNMEVIVSASATSIVYCFDGATGNIKWTASTGYGFCIDSPAAIADIDSDGKYEVILGTFWGYVYAFNGEDGSKLWSTRLDPNSCIQSEPIILDVNGDGNLDVIVTQFLGPNRIYALNGKDGSILWEAKEPKGDMYHNGSFADIDRDGNIEIVIGCYDGYVYCLNSRDGSLKWKKYLGGYIAAPTSIADFDKDGFEEIFVPASDIAYLLTNRGEIIWQYQVGGDMFRGGAISDIDCDGWLDIIFGSNDGKLHCLRGKDGNFIFEFDAKGDWAGENSPVIADFNSDGKLDIFFVAGKAFQNQKRNYGYAYALTFSQSFGPGWYMFKNDPFHSGFFPQLEGIDYKCISNQQENFEKLFEVLKKNFNSN